MKLKNKFILIISVVLFSCSAVKKVLKDKDKIEIVGREWEKSNPCVEDSFVNFISDTLIKYDTTYAYKLDTINKLDVVEIIDTVYINKYIRIKDSTKIKVTTGLRRLNIALDSLNFYKGLSFYYKAQYEAQNAETKLQKKRGNKWSLYFWLLLIIPIVLYVIYKILKAKFKN